MTEQKQRLPKITRNRLIAIGVVAAAAAAVAIAQPQLVRDLINVFIVG